MGFRSLRAMMANDVYWLLDAMGFATGVRVAMRQACLLLEGTRSVGESRGAA